MTAIGPMLVNNWQFPALTARKGDNRIHRFNRKRQCLMFINLIERMFFLKNASGLPGQRLENVATICGFTNGQASIFLQGLPAISG
jgi:hypothetical protein